MKKLFLQAAMTLSIILLTSAEVNARELVHDAEYYVIEVQNGPDVRWRLPRVDWGG